MFNKILETCLVIGAIGTFSTILVGVMAHGAILVIFAVSVGIYIGITELIKLNWQWAKKLTERRKECIRSKEK